MTVHIPSSPGRAVNTLVAIREGAIVASYAKLHLYDAFSVQESRLVDPGSVIPPLIEVEGFKIGLMTCYDIRFPGSGAEPGIAGGRGAGSARRVGQRTA